jgi:hypothetical protein
MLKNFLELKAIACGSGGTGGGGTGGGSQLDALIDGSITEIKSNVTSVAPYGVYNKESLIEVNLPFATIIGDSAFASCDNLLKVDLGSVAVLKKESNFQSCKKLNCVILRKTDDICVMEFWNSFYYTRIDGVNGAYTKDGYIYVPRALVDTYKSATNWSNYANQFRAIEDYPEICGGD